MAYDKEGKLGRSRIVKCLANHDQKISAFPGSTQKPQGESLGMMSFIWMSETKTHSLTLLLFYCSPEKERGR